MDAPATHVPPKKPRSRLMKWTIRLIVFVVGLVIAIAVILQILLWTDIPRKLVLQKLQNTLGLRVTAPVIHIGWSGNTTLEKVEISLPLAEQSFLEVPKLDVVHTSLAMIILTQNVTIQAATFHQPVLLLSQNKSGTWNVAEAIDLITRAGGKKQAQDQPNQSMPLPAVTVDDGTLKITDRNGKTAAINPLNVDGQPSGALVWKYKASADDRMKLTGEVSPGGVWEHEVDFDVHDIDPWLSPWVTNPPAFKTAGTWHGKVDGSNIDGRIDFDQLSVGTLNVQGPANVQRNEAGEVTVSPTALVVQTANKQISPLTMKSGSLVLSGETVGAKDLTVSVNGGDAKVNASYSMADQSASLAMIWRDIAVTQAITANGNINAKLAMPWPGAPRIDADITSSGKTAAGAWNTHLTLAGNGRAWNNIDWTATVSHLAWNGKKNLELNDVKATVLTRPDQITLQTLSVSGPADLTGSGVFNLTDGAWQLSLVGTNIPIHQLSDLPFTVRVSANGSQKRATLKDLSITSGQIQIDGNGTYDGDLPKPISLTVDVSHLPALEGTEPNSPIRGRVYGKASLSGTLSPVDIGIDQGMLYGSNVMIGERSLGDLAIQLTGQITASDARVQTTEASILGGKWRLRGEWDGPDTPLELNVGVRQLPLAQIADLLQQKNITGTMDGAWNITIPAADRMRITAEGSADIHNLVAGKFQAERVTAQSKFEQGKLTLDPIHLVHETGSADVHVDAAIQQPTQLNVTAKIHQWPATAPSGGASATVSAQTKLTVDLSKKSAVGPLSAELAFTVKDRDAGTLSVDTNIDGRVINVRSLNAAALGGTAKGTMRLPIDALTQSTANVAWTNLDASELAGFIPKAQGLDGNISGSLTVAPDPDPRAIGPLKITTNIDSTDLHYKAIDIGDANFISYFTGKRFVLDESTIHADGGEVHIWARSTEHYGDIRSSQLQIDFANLDLDKLDRTFDTNPKAMPGKLAGSFVVIGSIQNRDTLFGQGDVKITDSNLTNLHAIDKAYDYMNANKNSAKPTGIGQIHLRLDNNTLVLESASYFNNGIQLRARATLGDVWKVPDSPLNGTVIGSLRPLKDIKLPYFADADRIMNALQQNVTTLKITGTAREYHVTPISLAEAGQTMQKLLMGEVQQKP